MPMLRSRLLLDDPPAFLHWLQVARRQGLVSLQDVEVAHAFAVVAIAAMARHDSPEFLHYEGPPEGVAASGAARFAHAIGIDALLSGAEATDLVETYSLGG
jgi:hypothetical protein